MATVLVKFSKFMANYWGKPLTALTDAAGNPGPATLNYAGEFPKYGTPEDVRAANAWPDDKKIVKFVNRDAQSKAKSAAMAAAVESAGLVKPTIANDPQLRLKDAADSYFANLLAKNPAMDKDEARSIARAKASEFLEIEWDDEDEDE